MYEAALTVSIAVFLIAVVVAWSTAPFFRRTKRGLSPSNLLIVGTVLSLAAFFYPIVYQAVGGDGGLGRIPVVLAASLSKALSVFLGEGDYLGTVEAFSALAPDGLLPYCRVFGVILHLFAPFLTFSFVLSFVKNFSSMARYRLSLFRPAHIFSELNSQSLALAKSIVAEDRRRHRIFGRAVIVFTDVLDETEESDYDLTSESEKLGAILFRRDLEAIRFRFLPFGKRLSFYLLHDGKKERDEGEGEKLGHAAHLMREYRERDVSVYLFSASKESELFVACRKVEPPKKEGEAPAEGSKLRAALACLCARIAALLSRCRIRKNRDDAAASQRERARERRRRARSMRVVRINDVQSLIYHNLDRYGLRLFRNARELNGGHIHSLVVGLGQYGQEMLRALTWYAQVPGFQLSITAVDESKTACDRLRHECPEMMKRGEDLATGRTSFEEGEANYRIAVHPGVDVNGASFYDLLAGIEPPTHVFVSLGSDEKNIAVASAIRTYFATNRNGLPDIETVIYDTDLAKRMGMTWDAAELANLPDERVDGATRKKKPYRIHMIGDLEGFYSLDTLFDSGLVEAGLRTHIRFSLQYGINGCKDELEKLVQEIGSAEAALAPLTAKESRSESEEAELAALSARLAELRAATAEQNRAIAENLAKLRHLFACRERDAEGAEIPAPTVEDLTVLSELRADWSEDFYSSEYNYRSSMAKALAERLRRKLAKEKYIDHSLADVFWNDRSEDELIKIGEYEHIRWNAYMRSEGYAYADVTNHLAKHHYDLRPLSGMNEKDLIKDA